VNPPQSTPTGRDSRLPRCGRIVGRVADRDSVIAFDPELLENDLEDVRRRFGLFDFCRARLILAKEKILSH
jgi:hypothetical protein